MQSRVLDLFQFTITKCSPCRWSTRPLETQIQIVLSFPADDFDDSSVSGTAPSLSLLVTKEFGFRGERGGSQGLEWPTVQRTANLEDGERLEQTASEIRVVNQYEHNVVTVSIEDWHVRLRPTQAYVSVYCTVLRETLLSLPKVFQHGDSMRQECNTLSSEP